MLSVIIPIYNEEKYIHNCLQSIINQDYDKEDLEVLFVDGLSNDATRTIILQYAQQYSYIHLLDNPHRIVPYAMNTGIENAKGDIIMRLDAHTSYDKQYFSTLTKYLYETMLTISAASAAPMCSTKHLNQRLYVQFCSTRSA